MKKTIILLSVLISTFSFGQFNRVLNLDGVDDHISLDATENIIPDNDDFTLEFFLNNCLNTGYIFDNNGSTAGKGIAIDINAYNLNILIVDDLGYSENYIAHYSKPSGWFHFAWTYRKSDSLNVIYINGEEVDSFYHGYSGGFHYKTIGSNNLDGGYFGGQIDEFRISSNIRYSSNFTVPQTAFTNDANTRLLFHFDETGSNITTYYDYSNNSYDFTADGGISTIEKYQLTDDLSICPGSTTTLEAQGGTSYEWSTGINNSSIDVSPQQAEIYYVTVTNDTTTCQIIDSVIVDVYSVDLGNDTSFCDGTYTLDAGEANSYLWNTGNDTRFLTVNQSGTYIVQNAFDNCILSDTVEVLFSELVQPEIIQNGNNLACNEEGVFYIWYFNGDTIPNANSQYYTAENSGFYSVEVFDSLSCSETSELTSVSITNIDNINKNNYKIYPNPAKDNITIETKAPNTLIKINDINGKTVYSTKSNKEIINIDIQNLKDGIYFVNCISDKSVYTIKFLKY